MSRNELLERFNLIFLDLCESCADGLTEVLELIAVFRAFDQLGIFDSKTYVRYVDLMRDVEAQRINKFGE